MQITSAALLISISLVVFGIAYYYFTTRHKERMAILESGAPPDIFKKQSQWHYMLLSFGIISIGIAMGVLAGALMASYMLIQGIWVMTASIMIFLGISLILCYFILKSQSHKDRG